MINEDKTSRVVRVFSDPGNEATRIKNPLIGGDNFRFAHVLSRPKSNLRRWKRGDHDAN